MVCIRSSTSVSKLLGKLTVMANSLTSVDPGAKSKQGNNIHRNRKTPNSPNCSKDLSVCPHGSRSVAIDVVILIAVVCAFGFLLYPYIQFVCTRLFRISREVISVVKEEVCDTPLIYGCIMLSICCAALASWTLVMMCTSRRCGNPNCKGLKKAAEFDIQLETEERVKSSNSLVRDGTGRMLFELPVNRHRELQEELKKMAPPNGRAVLVFRARCGCPVGRLEVPGPKKQQKIKK